MYLHSTNDSVADSKLPTNPVPHVLGAKVPQVYASQVRLLNGCALCNMRMGNWEEAEQQLMEAFEKDAKSADTLSNLVTAAIHLGKPTSRYSK